MGNVICVDLSHFQTRFNFQDFKDGGGLGVILKASQGASIRDSDYSTFRRKALAADLAVASYHFLHPDSEGDMTAQAKFFLGIVNPRPSERVIADHEGRQGHSTPSLNDLVTFLQAIHDQRPDLQLTIYSGNVIKEQLGSTRNDWLAENTSLWIAQYTSLPKPSWPTGTWPTWSLWQYTDNGEVPGFNRPLDCNRFNGSDGNFLKWMGP
jgi:GH25 family lysozyme M1 (1,4-beta-N-acetylmuramidase)